MSTTDPATIDPEAMETPREKRPRARIFSFDNRYLPPFLITCILLAGQVGFGVLESFTRTGLAIAAAIFAELLLSRLLLGKWPHLASAYITGISVGILIRSPEFWPYIMCSAISITSKYALRWDGKHLWNPSNFGVSAMLFLAAGTVGPLMVQWGNQIWAVLVIWFVGSAIIWRLKRFHICAAYVLAFVAFAWIRSRVTGESFLTEVAPITGPPYQLFVFFMITDPRTTIRGFRGQIAVAVLVAAVELVFRLMKEIHLPYGHTALVGIHAPYYSLFCVGPVAILIEGWWLKRQQRIAESSNGDQSG